ncbi:MAG: 4-(cytidine 5'-diphospho)-2-C-methyl-D-erythritol kinase [Bacteroidota bacterium]
MISFPNAKINLGLNVLRRREDGYHTIKSCFYPIKWQDSIEVVEANSFAFHSYGLNIPGNTDSNLCIKAYQLFKKDFDVAPVAIHLLKQIPMGAGLGGGSADGAFTLKLLNDFFQLGLSIPTLEKYALVLGSDCPFFIKNRVAVVSGRGEILEPIDLDLSSYYLAIHNPEVHISTKEAYRMIVPKTLDKSVVDILKLPINQWQKHLKNDFEKSIFRNHPEIQQLKDEMYKEGALYAAMTGSGSAVFGIFEEEKEKDWLWITL